MSRTTSRPAATAAADRRLLMRVALGVVCVGALSVGIPATVAPHAFYAHFPWLTAWVALLPPYNQHLVSDVGGLQLAFGLLFGWAVLRPTPELVVPLCLAWSVSQLTHLLFHVTHLDGFGTADAIGQTAALMVVAFVPLLAAWLAWRPEPGGGVAA